MRNIETAKKFYNKYKDKLKIDIVFNLSLLLLGIRNIIDLNFNRSTSNNSIKLVLEILNNKNFVYKEFTSNYEKQTRFACTLTKNKQLLNKLKFENNILINHTLYGKLLEKDFYKCKLNKNVSHYMSINIQYKNEDKYIISSFLIQQCSFVDLQKNIKHILNIMKKYNSIAKQLSPQLSCLLRISNITN
jgi:hypothetical protein